ncbi:hypothetical protein CFOL_v3_27904, partial [Cephalotus follicularis]
MISSLHLHHFLLGGRTTPPSKLQFFFKYSSKYKLKLHPSSILFKKIGSPSYGWSACHSRPIVRVRVLRMMHSLQAHFAPWQAHSVATPTRVHLKLKANSEDRLRYVGCETLY